jgi:hypothetical protein
VSMSHEWHFSNPARSRGDRDNKSTREETERKTAVNLGLALMVIPLISLALWWAILSVVWPVVLGLLE